MNRKLIVVVLLTLAIPAIARAEGDPVPADLPALDATLPEIRIEVRKAETDASDCGSRLFKTAEGINEKIKPVKEIVGYVRSPQGLALKVVNDHVVKIPPWVGYALDPVGSIKHRAIDEIRSRAKSAMGDGHACAAVEPAGVAGTVDPAESI